MKHIFKPKYKICFQTRNKVWIYKNSRLRYFHRVRHSIVLRKSRFFKKYLITKNMKWTVARRKMVPYFRKKNRARYNYKNFFLTKQQLKHFYGDLKEYEMRNIFKRSWNVTNTYRCNTFLGALEQRLSMILFRMRFLPTIFSCHQYIKHKGILINEALVNHPNCCAIVGDVVRIPDDQWYIFYKFLYDCLRNRMFGHSLGYLRKKFIIGRLLTLRYRNKYKFIKNFKLLKTFKKLKLKFKLLKKTIFEMFKKVSKEKSKYLLLKKKISKTSESILINQHLNKLTFQLQDLKIISRYLYATIFFPLKKLQRKLKKFYFIRRWIHPNYSITTNKIIIRIFMVKNKIAHFSKYCLHLWRCWSKFEFNLKFPIKNNLNLLNCDNIVTSFENITSLVDKNKHCFLFRSMNKYVQMRLKKRSFWRNSVVTNRHQINYKLRRLKYKRSKRRVFKQWCKKPHLFIPHYFEVDFNTLRTSLLKHPEIKEVFYGFKNTFKQIISFYKERAL